MGKEFKNLEAELRASKFSRWFSNRFFVAFLCIAILVIGVVLQWWLGHQFVARSGAVLTLIGLISIYDALKVSNKRDQLETLLLNESSVRIGGTNAILKKAKWSTLFNGGVTYKSEQFNELKENAENIYEELSKTSDLLFRYQIYVVALGTMVWAFGDLLPEYVCSGV